MNIQHTAFASCFILTACATEGAAPNSDVIVAKASSTEICTDMGPQTPRDISSLSGQNLMDFALAPASAEMNLCNIHTHTNAEHKGPGLGFRSLSIIAIMAVTPVMMPKT